MDALFEESREDPPLYKNLTPVAGAIYWEKSLFHRMKRTVLRFMTLEAMMQTEQGKAVSCFYVVGVSGLVVECRTRNFQVTGSNLTAGHLQATLNKLLTSIQCAQVNSASYPSRDGK